MIWLVASSLTMQVATIPDKQAALDGIAVGCGMRSGSFTLKADGFVQMTIDPDEKYEAVDCALKKLALTEFRTKMGFIGNEAARPKKKKN